MAKEIRPKSISQFPNIKTNCLGFAIGCNEENRETKKYNLNPYLPLADSFLLKLKQLGYKNLPRKIDKLEDAKEGEYVFMVFGFRWVKIKNYSKFWSLTYFKKYPDYHVIRREPDGVWVHKPGWEANPCLVTIDDWSQLSRAYGHNFALFAFKPEKEE